MDEPPQDLPAAPPTVEVSPEPAPPPRDRSSALGGGLICGVLALLGLSIFAGLGRAYWLHGPSWVLLIALLLLAPGGLLLLIAGVVGVASAVADLVRK